MKNWTAGPLSQPGVLVDWGSLGSFPHSQIKPVIFVSTVHTNTVNSIAKTKEIVADSKKCRFGVDGLRFG